MQIIKFNDFMSGNYKITKVKNDYATTFDIVINVITIIGIIMFGFDFIHIITHMISEMFSYSIPLTPSSSAILW